MRQGVGAVGLEAAEWPARSTDRYAGPWNAATMNPILLINNRYDPATGYRNAQVAESRLGNAVLLTLDSYGHPTFQLRSQMYRRCQEALPRRSRHPAARDCL